MSGCEVSLVLSSRGLREPSMGRQRKSCTGHGRSGSDPDDM